MRRILAGVRRRAGRVVHRARCGLVRTFSPLPDVSLDELAPGHDAIAEPILDGICLPPYLGPTDHDDFTALMRIAAACRPEVIVELGTAYGNTSANLCRQCPDARVYTVNAPAELQTGDIVTFRLSPEQIGRVYRAQGFAGRVTQIFENTLNLDFGHTFPQPTIDLAIIDACHDTEYVLNDFNKLRPYVSPRGVVLFHDTHPSMDGHLAGSYLACVRLRKQGFDIRHVSGTWWAVWKHEWTADPADVGPAGPT